MSEVLHANIFFFIASIATILFTILLCLALYQAIKILITVRKLIERIEVGSEMFAEDIAQVRNIFRNGNIFSSLISYFMGMNKSSSPKKRKASTDLTITDRD